jgi:hypothetical protein
MENRGADAGRSNRVVHHGGPFAAVNQQMESYRARTVRLHHPELAWQTLSGDGLGLVHGEGASFLSPLYNTTTVAAQKPRN